MALDTFVAGRYSGSHDGEDLGVSENGYVLRTQMRAQDIGETDAYGEALIDGVYRMGRCRLVIDSLTYKSGTINAIALGGSFGSGQTCGVLLSSLTSSTVLSATPGTPATPNSLTGSQSILAPGYDVGLLFHSRVRKVPIELEFLFDGSSWFSTG